MMVPPEQAIPVRNDRTRLSNALDDRARSMAPSRGMHAVLSRASRARSIALLWMLFVASLSLTASASAQESCPRCALSDSADALPGLSATAVPQLQRAVSGSIVGTGGYGLTVSPLDADVLHHRVSGSLAGAVHLVPWLAIGARLDGRYDTVSGPRGNDDGMFAHPSLAARLSVEPTTGLALGLHAEATMYGSDAPSFEPASTTASFRALGAYSVDLTTARLLFALNVGYLLDNSRAAAPRALTDNLSPEDRLSLGVSDSGAVLASLGVAYIDELLSVHLDVDARVFTELPSATTVRGGVGVRLWLLPEVLFLGIQADARFTGASAELVAPGRINVPIDPHVTIRASLGLRIGADTPRSEVDGEGPQDGAPRTATPNEVAATTGRAQGRVLEGETPVGGAQVEVTSDVDGSVHAATTDDDGLWRLEGLPLGEAHYRIVADGLEPFEGTLVITGDMPVEASSALTRPLPQGEIRGVIQASSGRPIAARITIRPLERELTADAEGTFTIEVPPGAYDVVIAAPGHRTQTRRVRVEERGVLVLNVQLRAGR